MDALKVKWDRVISFESNCRAPILRWIDLGNGSAFRISAFFSRASDGMPRDGIFVGIEKISCYLFGMWPVHYLDVSKNLYVPEGDARALADWINAQLGNGEPQQGHYLRYYLKRARPIRVAGETEESPLFAKEENEKERTHG